MRKIKGIIYIILIILIVLMIGYMCFTGNRLNTVGEVGGVYEKAYM